MPHHEDHNYVDQLLSTDSQIHRATVVSSNAETGEIVVRAPNVTGADSTIDISLAGRKAEWARSSTHGEYKFRDDGTYYWMYNVPDPGDTIIVCREDADYTNVFWINTTVPQPLPCNINNEDDSVYFKSLMSIAQTSNQVTIGTTTVDAPTALGTVYAPLLVQQKSSWPAIYVKADSSSTTLPERATIGLHETIIGAGLYTEANVTDYSSYYVSDNEGDFYVYDAKNSKYNLWHTGHTTIDDEINYSGLYIYGTSLDTYQTPSVSVDGSTRIWPVYHLTTGSTVYQYFYTDQSAYTIFNSFGIITKNVRPWNATDGYDLGSNTFPWQDIYLENNPQIISDVNYKTDIQDSDLGLSFINGLRPVSFKWKQTGERRAGVRRHYGLIAQEVETVLGSKADSTALWTKDIVEARPEIEQVLHDGVEVVSQEPAVEEHEKQGLRYDELIGPMIKAIQELTTRVEALEG